MSRFHVSQIETYVRDLYESDHWIDGLDDVNNLSRLLALWALELTLGDADESSSTVEVTDGGEDRGIDAVGVNTTMKEVVFVQSKWRQDGTGSMALGDVLKFLQGVRSLLGMRVEGEPVHATEEMRQAVQSLLRTPGARIRLVTVTTASEPLSAEVSQPIEELLASLNDLPGTEPMALHRHLGQSALFNAIAERDRPSVDIELQILDWGKSAEPQKMYYGRVSAAQVAEWFSDHGADLFADNIRVVIPRSDINDGILQTIQSEPENFSYYNNGITILARSIELGLGGALSRDVGYFKLSGASIVNGAQTVSTLGAVRGGEFEANLGGAYVIVRCIEVPEGEEGLGQSITRYANTQNEVSSQDFAFLDEQQHRLARELQVLGFEYIVRSAEVPRSSDPNKVIEIRDAAVALACSHPKLNYAIIAKREVSRLFSEGPVYSALFNSATDPLALSRAVAVTAEVDRVLDSHEVDTDGVEAGVAIHARRVIAHVIMREIGSSVLANPSAEFSAVLAGVEAKATLLLKALTAVFPDNAYPGNVFKNQARVQQLLDDAEAMVK
ncbi:AIPR family protein [Microbacterium memoriense]|uniref:AIPR family protein n=1 Tax=Microbacterium memoriense TaxID=2978350 RepID=A0ABT2P8Q1_9MICO|nr:AIPR family protein [Microbacterium memoriense]MCT9001041.1 AIPR family protein [Microbacterium memoriense]